MRRMMMGTSDLLPLRSAPVALICTTVWVIVLAITDYPIAEWVGVTVIAYVVLWVTLLASLKTTVVALKWLHGYVDAIRVQMGNVTSESAESGPIGNAMAILILVGFLLAPVGLATTLTARIVAYMGFPPLIATIGRSAEWITVAGGIVILLFFAWALYILSSVSRRLRSHSATVVRRRQEQARVYGRLDQEEITLEMRVSRRKTMGEEFVRFRDLVFYHLPMVAKARG